MTLIWGLTSMMTLVWGLTSVTPVVAGHLPDHPVLPSGLQRQPVQASGILYRHEPLPWVGGHRLIYHLLGAHQRGPLRTGCGAGHQVGRGCRAVLSILCRSLFSETLTPFCLKTLSGPLFMKPFDPFFFLKSFSGPLSFFGNPFSDHLFCETLLWPPFFPFFFLSKDHPLFWDHICWIFKIFFYEGPLKRGSTLPPGQFTLLSLCFVCVCVCVLGYMCACSHLCVQWGVHGLTEDVSILWSVDVAGAPDLRPGHCLHPIR